MKDQWQVLTKLPSQVEVSTVELLPAFNAWNRFETCLFFTNGKSEVVASYDTMQEAIEGHTECIRTQLENWARALSS